MPVVIDSNLLVALTSGDPRADLADQQLRNWFAAGVDVHAPGLARYEFANALTGLLAAGALPAEDVPQCWSHIDALPIEYHPLIQGIRVVELSVR